MNTVSLWRLMVRKGLSKKHRFLVWICLETEIRATPAETQYVAEMYRKGDCL